MLLSASVARRARCARGLAPKVAELPALGVADPLADRELHTGGIGVRREVALGAGDPHHVADPAEVRVLHLQEVVVGELGEVAARDTAAAQ